MMASLHSHPYIAAQRKRNHLHSANNHRKDDYPSTFRQQSRRRKRKFTAMDTEDDEIRDDILSQPVIKRRITEQDVRSIHHSLNSLTFKPKKSIRQRVVGLKRKFTDI